MVAAAAGAGLMLTTLVVLGKGELTLFERSNGDESARIKALEDWAETFSEEARETLVDNWNWTGDSAAKIAILESRVSSLERGMGTSVAQQTAGPEQAPSNNAVQPEPPANNEAGDGQQVTQPSISPSPTPVTVVKDYCEGEGGRRYYVSADTPVLPMPHDSARENERPSEVRRPDSESSRWRAHSAILNEWFALSVPYRMVPYDVVIHLAYDTECRFTPDRWKGSKNIRASTFDVNYRFHAITRQLRWE